MKKLQLLSLLFLSFLFYHSLYSVVPYYSIRSQGENAARQLVGAGWNNFINRCNTDCWNGNLSITPEYTRSFDATSIGKKLFGCCGNRCCNADAFKCYTPCCCSYVPLQGPCCEPGVPCCSHHCITCSDDDFTVVHISGSQALNRMGWDWLADNFGLPTDYKSCLTFEPVIDNLLIDFNFYLGLDALVHGLYFAVDAPFVYTRWGLHMCEIIENIGTNNYWPGYFNGVLNYLPNPGVIGIARENLVSSFSSFVAGCDSIRDNSISFSPLKYAKINRCNRTKTGCPDVQMVLGYNFLCDDDYHVGFNIRASAPTGNRPTAEYLFEPIIGNGHHWQAGAGFSAHVVLGCNEDETHRWEFYADANVTHLFKAKQCRTFDLACKPLSRYMLAAKFGTDVVDLQAADADIQGDPENPVVPSHQFAGIYTSVANLTTLPVNVSVGIQADLALMLQHIHGNWSFDFGYNFWAKSCEDIKACGDECPFAENAWGLKGDAFMYGFKQNPNGSISSAPVALSATESAATIYDGTNNWPNGLNGSAWVQNPGIDNKKFAWDGLNHPLLILDLTNSSTFHIYTSQDPVLISSCDINLCGARIKGFSNKVFAHVDYTWRDCSCMIPYLGIGCEGEFGSNDKDGCGTCANNCGSCGGCGACCKRSTCSSCMSCSDSNPSDCQYCSLAQWGIWLKGGFSF